jgi:hypothetical protein
MWRRRCTVSKVGIFIGRARVSRHGSEWLGCGSRGHAASIPRASAAGRWPWGPARLASPPAPRPHGVVTGRKPERKGVRPDRRVPHVSGCGVWLVVSRPAGCVGPKGIGGLRCSYRAAVQDGGGLADFYCCGYGPKCKGPFPIFLNPSSYLNYDSNLN